MKRFVGFLKALFQRSPYRREPVTWDNIPGEWPRDPAYRVKRTADGRWLAVRRSGKRVQVIALEDDWTKAYMAVQKHDGWTR